VTDHRVFLLSPAHCGGKRAGLLMRPQATFDLARRLREGGAGIGEVFSFMSGLYFRGKMAYSAAFAHPPAGGPGVSVIVPGIGLAPPDHRVDLAGLRLIAQIPVDLAEDRYRLPLVHDAQQLAEKLGAQGQVVLLGSLATPKYLEPLREVFGDRLRYPADFVGRGDMSRGSLMLRCAKENRELTYVGVSGKEKGAAA